MATAGFGRGRSEQLYGPEIMELFREVKRAFDPLGIFNPGIILPSGEPPISRLKVGAGRRDDSRLIFSRGCGRSS